MDAESEVERCYKNILEGETSKDRRRPENMDIETSKCQPHKEKVEEDEQNLGHPCYGNKIWGGGCLLL